MAEAAKKINEAVAKKENAASAPGVTPENKPKKDIVSLISILVVTLNLAGVVALGVLFKKVNTKLIDMDNRMDQMAAAQKEEAQPAPKNSPTGRVLSPPAPGTLYPLEAFLVNISSDQGPKFLQTQMEFELTDAATEDEITKKKAAIRDAIIVLLSSRTYKQIRETTGMVNLRKDILRSVNNLLTSGQVREVYFTQFHFN